MSIKRKIYNHDIYQKGKPSVYGAHYKINLLDMIPKWNLQPGILQSTPSRTDSQDDKSSDDQQQTLFEFKQISTYQVDRMNQEVQVNQYMVSKLLGKGAQGMVRMASDTKKLYAIKIINCDKLRKKYFVKANELKQMISIESRLLSKLHHTNVIKFYQALFSEEYQKLCIVLEYCSRGSLLGLINNDASNDNWPYKVKIIVKQCLEGLYYLHHNSIAHRDIKSENILIAEKEVIKYCDFNISSKIDKSEQTNLGFQGTKVYGSPELLVMINNIVSPFASDVWALGMTFLEVSLRKHPFGEKTLQQLEQAVKEPVFIPDTIDPQLKDLISKMLDLDWRKRPTAKEMLSHPYYKS